MRRLDKNERDFIVVLYKLDLLPITNPYYKTIKNYFNIVNPTSSYYHVGSKL